MLPIEGTDTTTSRSGLMRKGIVIMAQPGAEELAVLAEDLGFSSFWVYDTPVLHADPFVTLALCAKVTSRVRLGIGVTSPALRSVPAAAAAFASLNALAPGRVICGVGTGNTARRALGLLPGTTAELESFTAALQGLCAGHTVEHQSRAVRLLHPGGAVNTADPVEFAVAALGPKAAAVAGRRGAGLISIGLPDPAAWHALHRVSGDGDSYLMVPLHVLEEDEDPYGAAARDATGHLALSFLTFAADTPAFAAGLSPEQRQAVQTLLVRRATTSDTPDRHLALYPGYLARIAPADRDLVLPSLIDALALVGTHDDLVARIAALEEAGVDEVVIQPVVDPPAEMARFAKLIA
ncbi:LLM class flavin-dependent oxidoreductase [Nonomuraea typhae]|uniref:LLM class flavin-dependent oxidoreductase n=1 Tax=Nonomuraea typhae TaxID=2603600 RepID=UPI001FE75320|nr:LLM class flavin-dependent oxidoreductase [Nonomuraea typhae]